ncbi:MAG: hypothetical protein ACTHMT_13620, partial [Verrucomicrobiota bacterium]
MTTPLITFAVKPALVALADRSMGFSGSRGEPNGLPLYHGGRQTIDRLARVGRLAGKTRQGCFMSRFNDG